MNEEMRKFKHPLLCPAHELFFKWIQDSVAETLSGGYREDQIAHVIANVSRNAGYISKILISEDKVDDFVFRINRLRTKKCIPDGIEDELRQLVGHLTRCKEAGLYKEE